MTALHQTSPTQAPKPAAGRLVVLWIAGVLAVTLHNLEEWLFDMTGWMATHDRLPGSSLHGDQDRYAAALVLVTLALLAVAIVALAARATWSAGVLVCVGYVLLANASSHVLMSLVAGSLMPGVVTGVLVLVPFGLLVLFTLPPIRWTLTTTALTVLAAVAFVGGSLTLAGPLTTLT